MNCAQRGKRGGSQGWGGEGAWVASLARHGPAGTFASMAPEVPHGRCRRPAGQRAPLTPYVMSTASWEGGSYFSYQLRPRSSTSSCQLTRRRSGGAAEAIAEQQGWWWGRWAGGGDEQPRFAQLREAGGRHSPWPPVHAADECGMQPGVWTHDGCMRRVCRDASLTSRLLRVSNFFKIQR